jgi:hypothetical protein
VVDFGHELITAVHTPIRWSDRRPSDDDFRDAFAATKLSAARVLAFVRARAPSVRALVLANSEGYWSDDGDFVNLATKHNFSLGHVGLLLESVRPTLASLVLSHCNDLFGGGAGALATLACLPALRVLRVEDVHCRLDAGALAELAALTGLEELALTAEEQMGAWAVGADALPPAWRALTRLRRLELRGHAALTALPDWLAELPALEHLDVAGCGAADVSAVSRCVGLRVLSLQSARLGDAVAVVEEEEGGGAASAAAVAAGAPAPAPAAADGAAPPPPAPAGFAGAPARRLPDLTPLVNLTAINLADNALTAVPPALARLPRLAHVDLSANGGLRVAAPLTPLLTLPDLTAVDLRGVHAENGLGYWSAAKCVTMKHVAEFARAAKRRPGRPVRVLVEVD